jgi:site-specific DNA-methyltransferase (adenine-specific)
MERWTIKQGDCREVMATLDADSIDAIVTDPPYGLEFMGKGWDRGVPGVAFWSAALRVAKPGAHLLAFGGTRTHHRLMCAIEDAGWEIRDCVMWVYGSGFPKSLDVSKAIDKAAGAERAIVGAHTRHGGGSEISGSMSGPLGTASQLPLTAPATDAAKQWQGWGTALKPAWEPIIVARKPLTGTVAENVQRFGTGAINVDCCRVGFSGADDEQESKQKNQHANFASGPMTNQVFGEFKKDRDNWNPTGRFPANLIHDGSEEVVAAFPSPHSAGGARENFCDTGSSSWFTEQHDGHLVNGHRFGDTGSAARFFYCAKASRSEREAGLAGRIAEQRDPSRNVDQPSMNVGDGNPYNRGAAPVLNCHPTVKPIALMRYLCRLVTQPGGLVLDPFTGSGSTGVAALLEGFRFVGIELDGKYAEIARARMSNFAGEDYDDDSTAGQSTGNRQMSMF